MYRILILVSAFLLTVSGMLFLQGERVRNPVELADMRNDLTITDLAALSAPATEPVPSEPSVGVTALAAAAAATEEANSQAEQHLPDDPVMAAMTARVLADLNAHGAQPGATQQTPLLQTIGQGQSDAVVTALLTEAAANGLIVVPEALLRPDGTVDTESLLLQLAARTAEPADAYTAALIAEATGKAPVTTGAEADTAAAPAQDTAERVYTVAPGDSLAAIAVKYYGTPTGAERIFQANRTTLESPNTIQVGQKLFIPY